MARFLYNGVELPALPAYDQETYPYVTIRVYPESDNQAFVTFTPVPLTYSYHRYFDGEGHLSNHSGSTVTYIQYVCAPGASEWVHERTEEMPAGNGFDHDVAYPRFTNYDMMDDRGRLFQLESVPVEVGSVATGVVLNRTEIRLNRGESFQFNAIVRGVGNVNQRVLWELGGAYPGGGTTLSNTGLLTVGEGEYSSTVTVTAVSMQDKTVKRTATVVVADFLSKIAVGAGATQFFNGLELPVLPEWDKETYPYVTIRGYLDGDHKYLTFAAAPFSYRRHKYFDGDGHLSNLTGVSIPYIQYKYEVDAAEWVYESTEEMPSGNGFDHKEAAFRFTNYDVQDDYGRLFCAAGELVTDSRAKIALSCHHLNETDAVYTVHVWLYRKAEGLDTTLPATFVSEVFGGPEWTMSHIFSDLEPNTEYGVYAAIFANGTGTDHHAEAAFTTLEKYVPPALVLTVMGATGRNVALAMARQGLKPEVPYTAEITVYDPVSTMVAAFETLTLTGNGIDTCVIGGLEPLTEYAVAVDIYPAPNGEVVLHGECLFTTTDCTGLGLYTGMDGVAHAVREVYVGVRGVAHRVKSIYVGVNGVARPLKGG